MTALVPADCIGAYRAVPSIQYGLIIRHNNERTVSSIPIGKTEGEEKDSERPSAEAHNHKYKPEGRGPAGDTRASPSGEEPHRRALASCIS